MSDLFDRMTTLMFGEPASPIDRMVTLIVIGILVIAITLAFAVGRLHSSIFLIGYLMFWIGFAVHVNRVRKRNISKQVFNRIQRSIEDGQH